VEVFSYPYGDRGANVEAVQGALRRAGYRAACLYGDGPNLLPVEGPYLLERVAMGPDTDLDAELSRSPRDRPWSMKQRPGRAMRRTSAKHLPLKDLWLKSEKRAVMRLENMRMRKIREFGCK
jgi:hypothetical protein